MARASAAEAARTRERLLDAALEVFWEEGVGRPSLTKVASRAGLTRGAVYGHFANKPALFGALCDRYLMPAALLERQRAEGADDPLGVLADWMTTVFRRARRERQYRMLLEILFLKCELVEGDDVRLRMRADAARVREHERALLQAAVERGQLPADLDVERATITVHAMLGGHLRYFGLHPELDAGPVVAGIGQVLRDVLQGPGLRRQGG
ncbi:MAG: TetR family transcriptional regulator [Alphaproteobacteria bacterium]|nr:TetR family transcriptional regulator [Alphaproteobacteria bacterium]